MAHPGSEPHKNSLYEKKDTLMTVLQQDAPKTPRQRSIRLEEITYRSSLRFKRNHVIGVPIAYVDGLLFTYLGAPKDQVAISGSFLGWTKSISMKQKSHGLYEVFIPINLSKGTYTYRFLVNKVWVSDPKQPYTIDDGYGTKMSAFFLSKPTLRYGTSPQPLGRNRYLFFLKDKGYKQVSWVGTKNLWDPTTDAMQLKNGYWQIIKKMQKKRTFYRYFVDGKSMLDPLNEHMRRSYTGETVNTIPQLK